MKKFEAAYIDKSFEATEASKGASVDGPIEFVKKSKKELGAAAKITSLNEFMDFARVQELTKISQAEGMELRDNMIENILGNMAREEEKMVDEIIGLVDQSDIDPEVKEDLFVALADVLTIKSVEDLDVTQVVDIIQNSNIDEAKKVEMTSKLRALVDSFGLVRN